ncbi:protein adenylyltransferase SelO [Chitinivorax sp. PXF-14]|uniref:protein adenylyltransferase SelO n=1 Tax=Chitinivorax sp. PXF-14 TaxID=3230488 RepID=UPI00346560A9
MPRTLQQLDYTNRFARLPGRFHSAQQPTPLPSPYLVAFNPDAAALLGLAPEAADDPVSQQVMTGNQVLPGHEPLSALYAGHQFGVYVPQLGDGRAILLGEARNERGEHWELQLKGAGETPYSRMGDGRAVLRSSIREYLCSEAMHGLGIPTTRALSIMGSDYPVYRETAETAAVVLRMSPSFIRFGSFEVFFYRNQHDAIRELADFVIDHYYPACRDAARPYQALLDQVIARTASLMADWQAVGFCHGVMNTDNMSVLGLTLDYGPFGFLDAFDPGHVCNHSDHSGRYAFDQQPNIALWNLHCFAQALIPLLDMDATIEALKRFQPLFEAAYGQRLRAKLGFAAQGDKDEELIVKLFGRLYQGQVDYTVFFRRLAGFIPGELNAPLRDLFIERETFDDWAADYAARLAQESRDPRERQAAMLRANPKYILRNHLAETAIRQAIERDYSEIERLRTLLAAPFDEQPGMDRYAALPPEWAQQISVSCSS